MNDKTSDKISYQKTLCALFASAAVLAFGTLSLLNNFSMDMYSLMFMLSIVIPAAASLGFIGFVLGRIFDMGKELGGSIGKIKGKVKLPQDPYTIQSMFAGQDGGEQSMFLNEEETE